MIIRVRFGKEGALRFIGHLDVLRTFQKIFRRAQIPMAYSQGFSPHPIMSFALPLGLGLTSEGEYLDAEIVDGLGMGEESPSLASLCSAPSPASGGGQELAADEILTRLRGATSEELPIYAVRILPEKAGNAMASVGRASYRLEIPEALAAPIAAAAEKLLAENSHVIERKTKTQTVSFDLRPCIYELSLCCYQPGGGDLPPCPPPRKAGEGGTALAVPGGGDLPPCPPPDEGEGGCRRQPGGGTCPPSIVDEKASLMVAFSDDVKKNASLYPPQEVLRHFSPPDEGEGCLRSRQGGGTCPPPDEGEGCLRSRQGGGDLYPSLFLTLSAGSRSNVKPELVWEELSRMAALPDGARPLSIRRLDLLTEDGTSLGAIGEAPESFCAERDNA